MLLAPFYYLKNMNIQHMLDELIVALVAVIGQAVDALTVLIGQTKICSIAK